MQRNAARAEAMLKQMANRHRLLVLCNLVTGEKTVSELMEMLGISQSALSQHLSKMRAAGLVNAEKRGQQVYYRISSVEAQALLSTLYLMFCNE
ncbi:metalloregulator ArsR/SmtB family transcription factor [bacterium]|nr:metalloregulator ArsR/SmtB family transcription factor [bacterium]